MVLALAAASCSSEDKPTSSIRAEEVGRFEQPVAMAVRDRDVFIAEQAGVVRSLDGKVLLDLTDRVRGGGEEGLLGIAFKDNDLYAYWTDRNGNNGVYQYANSDKRSEKKLLALNHPNNANHNGGNIAFGPDGALYVGTGDGGGGGDPDKNGQDTSSLLGKMLRLSPDVEILHYGLRNPWRFSFDRETGELWIADVGQGDWEEINKVPADSQRLNFGWSLREGTHPFDGGEKPAGAVDPVYEYNHDGGNCTVVGGYVYRGSRIPSLKGTYLFADYCAGELKKLVGNRATDLGIHIDSPSSFGQDGDGELYVLSLSGGVFKLVAA